MNLIFNTQKNLTPESVCLKSRVEGEIIVVLTADGDIEFLNETASFFYSGIDGNKSINQIFHEMNDCYDVDPSQLQEDIVELLRILQWKRIIRLTSKKT